jgi:hypothetical protein
MRRDGKQSRVDFQELFESFSIQDVTGIRVIMMEVTKFKGSPETIADRNSGGLWNVTMQNQRGF